MNGLEKILKFIEPFQSLISPSGIIEVLLGSVGFNLDDIFVLEVLADQLAVAIQNARNFEEALQRAEREQAAMEITSKIRASSDVDTMLRTAAQEMRHWLGARSARIHLAEVPLDLQTDGDSADQTTEVGHEPSESTGLPRSSTDKGNE